MKHFLLLMLKMLANFNHYVAKLAGWAPLGPQLNPVMVCYLELRAEDVDMSVAEEVLRIGPVPDFKDGVKALVEKFKKSKEPKKTR